MYCNNKYISRRNAIIEKNSSRSGKNSFEYVTFTKKGKSGVPLFQRIILKYYIPLAKQSTREDLETKKIFRREGYNQGFFKFLRKHNL